MRVGNGSVPWRGSMTLQQHVRPGCSLLFIAVRYAHLRALCVARAEKVRLQARPTEVPANLGKESKQFRAKQERNSPHRCCSTTTNTSGGEKVRTKNDALNAGNLDTTLC